MKHRVKFALKAKARGVEDKTSHIPKPLNKPCWESQTEITLLKLFRIKLIKFLIVGTKS